MLGTSAFYCKLCSELIADVKLADKHIKSEEHNNNYRVSLSDLFLMFQL